MIGLLYFITFYALQLLYCRSINRLLIKVTGKWRALDDDYPLWFIPIIGIVIITMIAVLEYLSTKPEKKTSGKLSKWFNSYDLKK
jgi:amino acid permease